MSILAAGACLFAAPAAALPDRPTVVELFTSQGCGSCGPANAYLGTLAKSDDIIALTYPVTYWDYLGWKDTFAKPSFDERQRAYAANDRSQHVYTPQMIIDGEHHDNNGNPATVQAVIAFQEEERPASVPVKLISAGKHIAVSIGSGQLPAGFSSATVWLLQYDSHAVAAIKSGENKGRREVYFNVVRAMTPIGIWRGTPLQTSLPQKELRDTGYSGFVVLLQAERNGPILGAAKLAFHGFNQ